MISSVFETERFRVHITGRAAWVEAREGTNWVFCNWHALPVAGDCGDSDALKSAVEHYEEKRPGDNSLRSALTGIRQEPAKQPAAEPAKPNRPVRAKKPSGYHGFRAPLRPPLMTPAAASLDPDCKPAA